MTPLSSPVRQDFDVPYETGYPPVETLADAISQIAENILSE